MQPRRFKIRHVRERQVGFRFDDDVYIIGREFDRHVFQVEVAEESDAMHVKTFQNGLRIGRTIR